MMGYMSNLLFLFIFSFFVLRKNWLKRIIGEGIEPVVSYFFAMTLSRPKCVA